MSTQNKTAFKAEAVCQLGVVVKDLDQVVKDWTENFGFGPWSFLESPSMRFASVFVGPLQFELMQPIEGKEQRGAGKLLLDYLNTWGDGVHHVAFLSDDVRKDAATLMEQGVERIADGGSEYAYFESGGPKSTIFELMPRKSFELIKEKGLDGYMRERMKQAQAEESD